MADPRSPYFNPDDWSHTDLHKRYRHFYEPSTVSQGGTMTINQTIHFTEVDSGRTW